MEQKFVPRYDVVNHVLLFGIDVFLSYLMRVKIANNHRDFDRAFDEMLNMLSMLGLSAKSFDVSFDDLAKLSDTELSARMHRAFSTTVFRIANPDS